MAKTSTVLTLACLASVGLDAAWSFQPSLHPYRLPALLSQTTDDETKTQLIDEPEERNGSSFDPGEAFNNLFKFAPRPPETPPPAESYRELLHDTSASASKVTQLEDELESVKRQLAAREEELAAEREGLQEQILSLEDLQDAQAEELEEKQRMEREVQILQAQLPNLQNALKTEQRRSEALQNRLSDVEDEIEFQQMEFQKEKKELEATLVKEKAKLRDIEAGWNMEKDRFQSERHGVEQELEVQLDNLQKSQENLQRTQDAFARERKLLESQLQEKRDELTQNQESLDKEKDGNERRKQKYETELAKSKEQLEKAEKYLADAQALFAKTESELKDSLEMEQDKVTKLERRLEVELSLFEKEKAKLESRIVEEKAIIRELEEMIRGERLENAKEKAQLELQLLEEKRIGQLKKKQMNNRYVQIRSELTSLWEGAKRETREERVRLTKKYEKRIQDLTSNNKQLESDLDSAKSTNEELQKMISDMNKEKQLIRTDARSTETQFTRKIATQNAEISALTGAVSGLKKKIQVKDKTIATLQSDLDLSEKQLRTIQTSYRQQLKASVLLTRDRLGRERRRLFGVFRRRKGE